MEVLIITVFCSLILVVGGLLLFFRSIRQGDFEHGDRLSLLPLEEDDNSVASKENKGSDGEGKGFLPDHLST